MKNMTKRFFSLLLAFVMVLSVVPMTAFATEHDHAAPEVPVSDNLAALAPLVAAEAETGAKDELPSFSFASILAPTLLGEGEVEIDETNPEILAVEAELNSMTVLNAEGKAVPLTDAEKQQILGMYQQYMDFQAQNADLLGVQTPFYLSYNDNKDNLGVLGEMLVLAGWSLDDVRAGKYTFDDLSGLMVIFLYTDQLGVQLYGSDIKSARDEALQAVKNSGAVTEQQKLLVLNDWLAEINTFDMPYIMGEDTMQAENPQPHRYYQTVYNALYDMYEDSITDTFKNNIDQGMRAELYKQFYTAVFQNMIYEGYLDGAAGSDDIKGYAKQAYQQAVLDQLTQDAYDKAYAEYLANPDQGETPTEPTEPEATEPEATEPEATEPEATEPEATEPEATEPEATEPEATEPTPTDPAPAVEAPVLAAEGDVDPDADAYAKAAVEAQKADLEAAAAAAANAATDEDLKPIINTIVYGDAEGDADGLVETDVEKEATAYAKQEVEKNADALAADARAVVEGMLTQQLGADMAAAYMQQIDAEYDAFIQSAETEGVEVDPVNYPGVKMTIAQIVEQQMDVAQEDPMLQKPDGSYMTPNEAVPVFADQAAAQSAQGVLNFWEGSHYGVFGEGKSVCLGYSKAYAYLVQCMHSEYYTKSGKYQTASDWKTVKELYYTNDALDINKGYFVDMVRIQFDAEVTMFGETQEAFDEFHFWNAVRVDGQWYYVDPCYTDVYVETMMRDRGETDGNVNHMYFMFSHDSTTTLYDGYYQELATLYANAANDKTYEDSWLARIVTDTTFDGGYCYYGYSSTDMISMMDQFNSSQNGNETEEEDTNANDFRLVRHKLSNSDKGDGDSDFETLIEFNYVVDEETNETVVRVYNPTTKAMEEHAFLTALYAQHQEDAQIYPSLALTCAKNGNLLYFNVSNYLLAYNLTNGEIIVVKEYNTVSAKRDKTNGFGAMAFSVVTSGGDLTVQDHPIAAIMLKGDGNLYVSIATNYSYISGKETNDATHAIPDDPGANGDYGYEYEESNYNSGYSSFSNSSFDTSQMEAMGYDTDKNDNDEFMWTANFVETNKMSSVAVSPCQSHTYAAVAVEANCEHNAYTVNICSACGAVEAGTYAETADTIHNHHYVHYKETYYTKNSSGDWNTGESYVCTECGYHVVEPTKPKENQNYGDYGTSYEEQMVEYEKKLAIWNNAKETCGHEYTVNDASWSADNTTVTFKKLTCDFCKAKKAYLDCLLKDATIETTLSSAVTAEAKLIGYSGDCTDGATAIYNAAGSLNIGGTYNITKEVKLAAGNHAYEAAATWNLVVDAEGKAVLDANGNEQYTVDATLTCPICGDIYTETGVAAAYVADNSYAPTCEGTGLKFYTATITAKDGNKEIGAVTVTNSVEIPANGHDYVSGICSVCGDIMLTDPTILSCYSKLQTSVKVTWTPVENADGYELWRATDPEDEENWMRAKTVKDGTADRYTNQDLEKGTTYYYKVRAYVEDAEGNRTYSNFSNVDYMPAAVVWDGPYSNATFRIRLRWNEIGGSHGYQIWRLNDDGETWNVVKTLGDKNNTLTDNQGATTAYSNTGLTAGKQYTYKIRAFMIPEEGKKVFGAYSDEFTIAVMPETPVLTVTSPKAGRAQLDWEALNGAAGYQIWMNNTDSDAGWAIIKSVTDGSTSYTKSDLKSGTYEFRVRAYTEVDGKKTFGGYSEVITIKVK